jgi:micrococcal nuclease
MIALGIFFKSLGQLLGLNNQSEKQSIGLQKHTLDDLVSCRVKHVLSGNSIIISNPDLICRVQLEGIDCPDTDDEWGERARVKLAELINDKYVYMKSTGGDDEGRVQGIIFIEKDKVICNINELMVMEGLALVNKQDSSELDESMIVKLQRMQRLAQANAAGIWKEKQVS